MKLLWLKLVVAMRRARCRWFGCIPPDARRHFVAGDETQVFIGVTVHCHRCWRRYEKREQDDAVRYLQETLP